MNALSFFKLVLVSFIVITGFVVMGGGTRVKDPMANFRDLFAGSSPNSNDYATAMFKVLNAYAGWGNVNNVLNEYAILYARSRSQGPLA
ncbi:hypothetical protein SISNIDRAFT_314329 [Sistotremastrum niveocremeum HHB9708]|uniref:Uncharacterized protein n=1 Tax=Sistotremastrum niveocremeum HHB9708 TaxID=1314777 RepID=A0A164XYI3_9AGAM|nr:hypothetical protein SISNIDRAFT_314329 [Sistotremastrum niveocremeum HHB9708]